MKYAPEEKTGLVIVDNFPELGRLTALRFIEWIQDNPDGVVALPTGKTPEYFIKFMTHYLKTWATKQTQKELETHAINPAKKPQMKNLHFVQIDEFYPIDPAHHNSFNYYVKKYYMGQMGFDIKKARLIDATQIGIPKGWNIDSVWGNKTVDLSLRFRHANSYLESIQKSVLEALDQWCFEYGEKIRAMGGITFFLGGIGPDGHIAFNVTGTDHHSTTRLTPINYETQATSSSDLGGIEVARQRHAITIGLSTITYNPDCTAIIMAAGEAKAKMVAESVCHEPHIKHPATVLQKLPNARFYITQGAARLLEKRNFEHFKSKKQITENERDNIMIQLALKKNRALHELTLADIKSDSWGNALLEKTDTDPASVLKSVEKNILAKLERGSEIQNNKRFLHTAPHHDDIMLGYFPYAVRHMRDPANYHMFAYMTSGFNAVTNQYALHLLENLNHFLGRPEFTELIEEGYFDYQDNHARNRDVWQYLDGVAAKSRFMKQEGESRRLLRNLMEVFEEEDIDNLVFRIDEMISYFKTQYAGKKDISHIQKIKGMIREWEADCLWGYMGFDNSSVQHLRLGFYKGDLFTEEPTIGRDVDPVFQLLNEVNPDVVTVALDPEASGPDTHYKVLQTLAEALKMYETKHPKKHIEVWGYRNVWYRFEMHEANCYVPVSNNMFAVLESAFMNAFVSQKNASFPSYEYDGPFSGLAQKIQVEQYKMMKTCLGREYFNDHHSPLIRGTRGFVFLKILTSSELYEHARDLQRKTEEI